MLLKNFNHRWFEVNKFVVAFDISLFYHLRVNVILEVGRYYFEYR